MSVHGNIKERGVEPSFATLLIRYLSPFWLFKDASCGDRYARAAAYRHNRDMRVHLPCYLRRWFVSSALAFGLTAAFDSVALESEPGASASSVFSVLAAGGGVLFATCVCMLVLIGYIYVYLGRWER